MNRTTILALCFWLLAACGSDDGGSSSGGTTLNPSSNPVFSIYCTGVLKNQMTGMLSENPFAWAAYPGHRSTLPPGTEILLESSFGKINGYAILFDGAISKVDADFSTGLLKDTDYISECPESGETDLVLLKTSHFFADATLSGQPCAIDAGTTMNSVSLVSNNGKSNLNVAEVKSAKIKEICGFEVAYSADMVRGDLLKK